MLDLLFLLLPADLSSSPDWFFPPPLSLPADCAATATATAVTYPLTHPSTPSPTHPLAAPAPPPPPVAITRPALAPFPSSSTPQAQHRRHNNSPVAVAFHNKGLLSTKKEEEGRERERPTLLYSTLLPRVMTDEYCHLWKLLATSRATLSLMFLLSSSTWGSTIRKLAFATKVNKQYLTRTQVFIQVGAKESKLTV